ncbi:MAG TPA: formate--tetrahydrofolate ligase [candidate division Zixibacteria bacterium]|nr:formate--tetrahydrofolate ligase [candidate division Zixibacteria bacterium]
MAGDNPELLPITEVAAALGLGGEEIEPYGRYAAKVRLSRVPPPGTAARGKLLLVTATTPDAHGEGKTLVSIGLAQALRAIGKKSIVTLREPSLGPVFGIKGGATGGGRSQVLPADKINLHFTGDKHAVAAAHNLLAAMTDAHLYHGNELGIDPERVFWPRTVDMNDRALREVMIGLGGKTARRSRFVITAASEIMAVLALAASRADLDRRLAAVTVALGRDGRPVRAADLKASGAMAVLLNDALLPNLVQTTERAPALIHAGPFANIAHGTSSVIAQRLALDLAEYVVNETGFAADLGVEKYVHLVMPASGFKPSAAVLVTTLRGLRHQGGDRGGAAALEAGFENLAGHVAVLRRFGLPVVAALNRFAGDEESGIRAVGRFCEGLGVEFAVADCFRRGGQGAVELAAKAVAAADRADPDGVRPLYTPELAPEEKIAVIATEVYGATSVDYRAEARAKLKMLSDLGFGRLPVCIAKTQYSLSDDPRKLGAPRGWTLTITDVHLASGAGFIVAVAGNMMLMPGLPKTPHATAMSVAEDGTIRGL